MDANHLFVIKTAIFFLLMGGCLAVTIQCAYEDWREDK